jgi:AAA domain/UvrD-like helicase C-terminal domain
MVQDRASSRRGLSAEQQRVSDQIDEFINSRRQVFSVCGCAGTGKTYLLSSVASRYPDAIIVAPTGKASCVLRERSGLPATTIHKALFHPREERREGKKLEFDLHNAYRNGGLAGRLILLDEHSMCTRWLGNQLRDTGAQIVSFGDDFQLPPVGGDPFFSRADAVLMHVHRQALTSPIIRQALRVRDGRDYQADGDDFRVVRSLSDEQLGEADAVLCWRNSTRNSCNLRLRRRKGWSPHVPPQAGEPVLCLKNSTRHGIFNGATYQLAADYIPGSETIAVLVDREPVSVEPAKFHIGAPCDPDSYYASGFDYGYALTTHKAQGSEWDYVILIDEYPESYPDRSRWLYTGLTRAAKRITVVRP